jgi:hypothetical protein
LATACALEVLLLLQWQSREQNINPETRSEPKEPLLPPSKQDPCSSNPANDATNLHPAAAAGATAASYHIHHTAAPISPTITKTTTCTASPHALELVHVLP